MPLIDISADAGDAVIGHMDRHFMDNDGYNIRHGDEDNFHKSTFLSMRERASAMRPESEKASLS